MSFGGRLGFLVTIEGRGDCDAGRGDLDGG